MAAGDTIFAAATGTGRAALSVVRISGPATKVIVGALCNPLPAPRFASLRSLRAHDGDLLDRALVLWFPAPGSYTGEDSAELDLHGGPAVLEAVGNALSHLGARPAEPGEFTRRAFLNGRHGLIEAEAIGDLVDAETQAQRRQALRQLQGELGDIYRRWTGEAGTLLARVEASIDFADEDSGIETEPGLVGDILQLEAAMRAHLSDGNRGERLREGLVVAIVGAPNVGKSSLMNALAGEDVAIVAASPGTTRDTLERRIVLGDTPVTLVDTAGLRATDDPVEAEGIRRAERLTRSADLVMRVEDARTSPATHDPVTNEIVVASKRDLLPGAASSDTACPAWADLAVSARTGCGMRTLRDRLAAEVRERTHTIGTPSLTRVRHRAALTDAACRLGAACRTDVVELRAEELRLAVVELGRVTGHVGTEDILGEIFGRFCIGK